MPRNTPQTIISPAATISAPGLTSPSTTTLLACRMAWPERIVALPLIPLSLLSLAQGRGNGRPGKGGQREVVVPQWLRNLFQRHHRHLVVREQVFELYALVDAQRAAAGIYGQRGATKKRGSFSEPVSEGREQVAERRFWFES